MRRMLFWWFGVFEYPSDSDVRAVDRMCKHENAQVVWTDQWLNYYVCECGDEWWDYHMLPKNEVELTVTRGM